MLVDYHMHLERDTYKGKCRFTLQRVEEYVEAARRAGVDEIAVTEHVHWFRPFRPMMEPLLLGEGSHSAYREWAEACFHEELDEYVEVLVRAKQKGLPVKVGLEVDWIEGYEEDIARILEPYPWDILLGSVHFLGPWCIDFAPQVGWPERRVDDVYAQYLQQLEKLAASGLVDVLAHPDLPKKIRPPPGRRHDARVAAGGGGRGPHGLECGGEHCGFGEAGGGNVPEPGAAAPVSRVRRARHPRFRCPRPRRGGAGLEQSRGLGSGGGLPLFRGV